MQAVDNQTVYGARTCLSCRESACRGQTRACPYPRGDPAFEASVGNPLVAAVTAWGKCSRLPRDAQIARFCPRPTRCRLGVSECSQRRLQWARETEGGVMDTSHELPAAEVQGQLSHQQHRSGRELTRNGLLLGYGKCRVPNAGPHHSKRHPDHPSAHRREPAASLSPVWNEPPHPHRHPARWLHEPELHWLRPATLLNLHVAPLGLG